MQSSSGLATVMMVPKDKRDRIHIENTFITPISDNKEHKASIFHSIS